MKKLRSVFAGMLILCMTSALTAPVSASAPVNPPAGQIVTQEDEASFGSDLGYEGGSDKLPANYVTPRASYTLKNISTTKYDLFEPLTDYVENREYSSTDTWPEVSCERGDGLTVTAEVNAGVEISSGVVSGQVGYTVGGSYSVTASQSYSYKVAYGRATRIVIRWSQKYSDFDVYSGTRYVTSGDCWGAPTNKRVTSQSYNIW